MPVKKIWPVIDCFSSRKDDRDQAGELRLKYKARAEQASE